MNESERLAGELDKALNGEAWHGPSWREALEGVTPEQALAHPVPGAHSIAEVVRHAATWHDVVRRRLVTRVMRELQFGHGSDAVETPTTPSSRPSRGRFNSATALRPWRRVHREPVLRRHHRFNSATALRPWRQWRQLTAFRGVLRFNSATALRPWRRSTARASWPAPACFNSATALRPWRLVLPVPAPGPRAASIRPRL